MFASEETRGEGTDHETMFPEGKMKISPSSPSLLAVAVFVAPVSVVGSRRWSTWSTRPVELGSIVYPFRRRMSAARERSYFSAVQ